MIFPQAYNSISSLEQLRFKYPEIVIHYIEHVILYVAISEHDYAKRKKLSTENEVKDFKKFLQNHFFSERKYKNKKFIINDISMSQDDVIELLTYYFPSFKASVDRNFILLSYAYQSLYNFNEKLIAICPDKGGIKNIIRSRYPKISQDADKLYVKDVQEYEKFKQLRQVLLPIVLSVIAISMIAKSLGIDYQDMLLIYNPAAGLDSNQIEKIKLAFTDKENTGQIIFSFLLAAIAVLSISVFLLPFYEKLDKQAHRSLAENEILNDFKNAIEFRKVVQINTKKINQDEQVIQESAKESSSNNQHQLIEPFSEETQIEIVCKSRSLSKRLQLAFEMAEKDKKAGASSSKTSKPKTGTMPPFQRSMKPRIISFKPQGPYYPLITEENDRRGPKNGFIIVSSQNENDRSKYYIAIDNKIYNELCSANLWLKLISKILYGDMVLEGGGKDYSGRFFVIKDGAKRLYIDQEHGFQSSNIPVRMATLFSQDPHMRGGNIDLRKIPQASEEMLVKL